MPFNAALSGGQITQVRKTDQAFEHYLLVNPNDIVWQADVDENITAKNYAEFNWTNTLQGDPDNVIAGQIVLVTTSTTDFSDPVIRGRIRKVPNATDVFINETGTDITNSMYVTVIDDFDIMERLQRVTGGIKYKDWDLVFSDLPPIIDGLQSVYADFSGANPVTLSFAPTATAVADGAAISTWLWDVGDGTITVGNSGTQNITATFPGFGVNEHRWVHLTVTDDNGNATTFHFEVYTVNKQSSTAVKLDTGQLQITSTIEDGWNGSVSAWDGFLQSEVLDMTRVAIASIDDYDGTTTPIVSNIMLVGRLRVENNQTIADELSGEVAEVTLTIEGFATQLARLPAPALSIQDDAAPADWGEITDPDPLRSVVYFLAYHTTFCTLSSISHDTFTNYVLGDYSLGETTALDNVNKQLDSANAIAAFAPAGETTLRRRASYQSTADRAGLTTIFDFTTADITPDLAMDFEYGETVGEIEAGAVVYDTTNDEVEFRYIGRAPASSFGSGHETAQLNGQVLIKDSTDVNARAELVQRAADHLRYINPKIGLTTTLMDGFWWMIPTLHQRWTFTLAATDTARGRVYTSSEYWQLVSTTYTADNDTNTRELSATFEEETQGENAGISVTLVPDPNDLDFSLPPLSPYDSFPDDPLTNFPVDDPAIDPYYGGGMAGVMEPTPNNDSPLDSEVLNIPMWFEQSRATTRNTTVAAPYVIKAEGDNRVTGETWEKDFDFSVDDGSWSLEPGYLGAYVAGNYWEVTGNPDTSNPGMRIGYNLGMPVTITRMRIYVTLQCGATSVVTRSFGNVYELEGAETTSYKAKTCPGASGTDNWFTDDFTADYIKGHVQVGAAGGGSYARITRITVSGTGANPFGVSGGERGDAFYTDYIYSTAQLYGAGEGLLVNGAKPGTIPPYQSNHEYLFEFTGTGAPVSFKYSLADFSETDRNRLKITVTGDNMGTTS